MFPISLYTTSSPTNKVTKDLTLITTINGVLRHGTSVIDPVIVIQTDSSEDWRKKLNYAYIEAFGRYYYVTNIISVNGQVDLGGSFDNPYGLWELHMHVDVLMSYADGIKSQKAIVARQERTFNLMLDDGIFMTYQNPKIQTKLFSVANPFETQEFVIVVAGS